MKPVDQAPVVGGWSGGWNEGSVDLYESGPERGSPVRDCGDEMVVPTRLLVNNLGEFQRGREGNG